MQLKIVFFINFTKLMGAFKVGANSKMSLENIGLGAYVFKTGNM